MNLNLDGVSSNLLILYTSQEGMGSFEKLVKFETGSLEREGRGGGALNLEIRKVPEGEGGLPKAVVGFFLATM